jgi:hypothetical protein
VKEAGRKREVWMRKFMEEMHHLANRPLSDEEWLQFANMVDALVGGPTQLYSSKTTQAPHHQLEKAPKKATTNIAMVPNTVLPPRGTLTPQEPLSQQQESPQ